MLSTCPIRQIEQGCFRRRSEVARPAAYAVFDCETTGTDPESTRSSRSRSCASTPTASRRQIRRGSCALAADPGRGDGGARHRRRGRRRCAALRRDRRRAARAARRRRVRRAQRRVRPGDAPAARSRAPGSIRAGRDRLHARRVPAARTARRRPSPRVDLRAARHRARRRPRRAGRRPRDRALLRVLLDEGSHRRRSSSTTPRSCGCARAATRGRPRSRRSAGCSVWRARRACSAPTAGSTATPWFALVARVTGAPMWTC